MEDGDTESYQYSRVIQDIVFLCRKMGSINGYNINMRNAELICVSCCFLFIYVQSIICTYVN